jgi:hypothetical protein
VTVCNVVKVVIGRLCVRFEVRRGGKGWGKVMAAVLWWCFSAESVITPQLCVCVRWEPIWAGRAAAGRTSGRRVCKVLFLLAAAAAMARGAVYHTCSTLYGLKVELQRDQQNLISGSRPRFKPKSSAIYHSLLLPAALPVHTLGTPAQRYFIYTYIPYALLHGRDPFLAPGPKKVFGCSTDF